MKQLNQMSVQYIKGVGPSRKKLFENLGVYSVEDLLYLFPRRYEDRRNLTPIKKLKIGEWQTVCAKVLVQGSRRSWYTKKHVTEVALEDDTGRLFCIWFNQPYLSSYFKPGRLVVCHGKVDMYKNRIQMVSPEYEILENEDEQSLSLKRIVPIYPLTRGISQRYLRKLIKFCLDHYSDDLVDELSVQLRNKNKLANIKRSIANSHFPEDFKDQQEALKRISFEEFFFFQVSILLRRLSIIRKKGIKHKITGDQIQAFADLQPFSLTNAQKKVMGELKEDLEKPTPMLRLLQGDVGSGKTVMAIFGCWASFKNGYQSAIMAPTEILARQHYENLRKLFEGIGYRVQGIANRKSFINPKPSTLIPNIALLTSSLKLKEKQQLLKDIKEGKIDVVIGTHALINDEVKFKNLSFVVIDEQHKFGVRQRALLTEKGSNPDILIMTATPIPRTLCITLYGDLDLSVIDELPPGRGKILTKHFPEEQSKDVYKLVKESVKKGRQAYIVYPIIEESEKLDLKAAQDMFKQFKKDEFKDLKIGLLHGQMKKKEAQKTMTTFKQGKIDVLVATTVLEVGIDVPNATVMVIEHAQRFGLSQLHQLRGRIGRGAHDSFCYLIGDVTTEDGAKRLKAICSTTDGFKIAQEDLLIRGPGRYFDRHQHGLNELKVANPATQLDILELAREEARALVCDDPKLIKEKNPRIKEVIQARYPAYLRDIKAG